MLKETFYSLLHIVGFSPQVSIQEYLTVSVKSNFLAFSCNISVATTDLELIANKILSHLIQIMMEINLPRSHYYTGVVICISADLTQV